MQPSSIDAISKALPLFGNEASATPVAVGTGDNSFGNTLTRLLNEVSDAKDASGDLTQRFARGENVELHEVMAASEEAGIALDLLIELRNKAVEAYRSVLSMQS